MIKSDVSILYKTKMCKKYSMNGYCPYGMRCQFIHDLAEAGQVAMAPPQKKAEISPAPQVQKLEVAKAPLSINSAAFQVNKETKQATVAVPMVGMGRGAIQAASGTGGFGNRQAAAALDLQKVIYKDILIHNLHVSIQESQKKSKMYQKKLSKKRQDFICPPDMQYMNIYKQSAKRLSVFEDVSKDCDDQAQDSFFGDATAYEKQLDADLKNLMENEKQCNKMNQMPQMQQQYYPQQQQAFVMQSSLEMLASALNSQTSMSQL